MTTTIARPEALCQLWPSLIDVMSSTNRVVTFSSSPVPKPKPCPLVS